MADTPWAEAQAAGCIFYALPDALDYTALDPLIAPICRRINESGWVATAESCQGHPDDPDPLGPWAGNMSPFLRLTCRRFDAGLMLVSLLNAFIDADGRPVGMLRLCEDPRGGPHWTQYYVYGPGEWVGQRDATLAGFARFAEAACREASDA